MYKKTFIFLKRTQIHKKQQQTSKSTRTITPQYIFKPKVEKFTVKLSVMVEQGTDFTDSKISFWHDERCKVLGLTVNNNTIESREIKNK